MTEQVGEFVVNDLHQLLAGRERGHNLGAEGLLADVVEEFLDDLYVDVGFEESETNFAQGFADVFFGEFALSTQVFEGAL